LTNVVPESEAITLHAKINGIDVKNRALTLVGANGRSVTVTAGPAVRLELLKVSDSVDAKYYRSVGFVVSPSQAGNSAPVATDRMTQVMARPAKTPGGDAVRLTTLNATVVGLDVAARTVDVVSPSGGGVYTIHVTDRERAAKLASLKVGDTITAVVSEPLPCPLRRRQKAFLIDPRKLPGAARVSQPSGGFD